MKKKNIIIPDPSKLTDAAKLWWEDSRAIVGCMIGEKDAPGIFAPEQVNPNDIFPEDSRLTAVINVVQKIRASGADPLPDTVKLFLIRNGVTGQEQFVDQIVGEENLHRHAHNRYLPALLHQSRKDAASWELGHKIHQITIKPGMDDELRAVEIQALVAQWANDNVETEVKWIGLNDLVEGFVKYNWERYEARMLRGEQPMCFPPHWGKRIHEAYEFEPNELVTYFAPTGHGKTIAAMEIAYYNACNGYLSAILLMETNQMSIARRWVAQITGVPTKHLKGLDEILASPDGLKGIPEVYANKLKNFIDKANGLLYLVPIYGATYPAIETAVRKAASLAKQRDTRALVIWDYLQAYNWRAHFDNERVGFASGTNIFKAALDETGSSGLMLSQSNEGENAKTLGSFDPIRRAQIVLRVETRPVAEASTPFADIVNKGRRELNEVRAFYWMSKKGFLTLTPQQCIEKKIMPGKAFKTPDGVEFIPIMLAENGKTNSVGWLTQYKANDAEADQNFMLATIGPLFKIMYWDEEYTVAIHNTMIDMKNAIG